MQTFLDELAAGNVTAALELTTSSRDDFACRALTADTDRGALTSPTAGDASIEGDKATVNAHYTTTQEGLTELSFTVERADDLWLVVLPETYQIALEFDAPTVAQVDISRVTGNPGSAQPCRLDVRDGKAHTPALPGTYVLNVADPSGVFAADRSMTAQVNTALAPTEVPAINPDSLDFLSQNVAIELRNMFIDCLYNDFEPAATCPAGTEGAVIAGDPTDVHNALLEAEPFALDQVWTEDERAWLFTTNSVSVDVVRDGVHSTLEVLYSGRLKSDDGDLQIVLD